MSFPTNPQNLADDGRPASRLRAATEYAAARARRAWVMRWLGGDLRAAIAVSFLVGIVLVALVGPIVHPIDPLHQDLSAINQGPSALHWLGTDDVGRDILSRLLAGTSISLKASLLAVSVGLVLGVPAGLLAGYRGGYLDDLVMRLADSILAFPALILAIAVTAMTGPGVLYAMTAMGVVFAPVFARLVRAQVLQTKQKLYVLSAISFGASGARIVLRHVVPNSVQPVLIQASLYLAAALIAEASLSFLGLGVQPPEPAWGSMLGRGYRNMYRAPWQMVPPGLAIMLTAWAFNAIGDSLRDAMDPRSEKTVRPKVSSSINTAQQP